MSKTTLEKLDKYLRIMTWRKDNLFGGVHIIFAGDFYQIPPVVEESKALYTGYCIQWEVLNTTIILENNHRFREDPECGKILERISNRDATFHDMKKINSRVMTSQKNSIKALTDPCYACTSNSERNSISTDIFMQHVRKTHNNSFKSPCHTIIIESAISKKKKGGRFSKNYHTSIFNNCGDADIATSSRFVNKQIDLVLKLYTNIPLMLTSNEYIEQGCGNGTQARFKNIVLKENATLKSKVWDGFHTNTVSVDNIRYMVCEHWEGTADINNNSIPPKPFRLYPEVIKVDIKIKLYKSKKNMVFKNQYIKQFGVLVNNATTGHKLQGMSKDNITIVDWFYSVKNWVYVVLSRVKTLSGLHLFKELKIEKYFKEDKKIGKAYERA